MNPNDISVGSFDALTFDCYGTIIDWERGILDVLRPWAAEAAGLRPPVDDRTLLQAFARCEPLVQDDAPDAAYPDVLRRTYDALAEHLGLPPTPAVGDRLAASIGDWPVFPDSVAALQRLARHAKLVIVSNVDRASFERTRTTWLRDVEIAAVVTAEEVGAYKPDPAMFRAAFAAVEALGVPAERVQDRLVHVAESLFHDITPATALGLRTVWVDRHHGGEGGASLRNPDAAVPTRTVHSLAEFADVAGA
jgi:2-haloacid dehalogenase